MKLNLVKSDSAASVRYTYKSNAHLIIWWFRTQYAQLSKDCKRIMWRVYITFTGKCNLSPVKRARWMFALLEAKLF